MCADRIKSPWPEDPRAPKALHPGWRRDCAVEWDWAVESNTDAALAAWARKYGSALVRGEDAP